jgi:hypothetical protein
VRVARRFRDGGRFVMEHGRRSVGVNAAHARNRERLR